MNSTRIMKWWRFQHPLTVITSTLVQTDPHCKCVLILIRVNKIKFSLFHSRLLASKWRRPSASSSVGRSSIHTAEQRQPRPAPPERTEPGPQSPPGPRAPAAFGAGTSPPSPQGKPWVPAAPDCTGSEEPVPQLPKNRRFRQIKSCLLIVQTPPHTFLSKHPPQHSHVQPNDPFMAQWLPQTLPAPLLYRTLWMEQTRQTAVTLQREGRCEVHLAVRPPEWKHQLRVNV